MDFLEWIQLILIGAIWAYFGAFFNGVWSAIVIWLLSIMGAPASLAGITFKLAKLGDQLGGLRLFKKHGHIPMHFIWWWWIWLFIGGFCGSYLITSINENILFTGSGISMLILALYSFYKKSWWTHERISKIREYMGYTTYFIVSFLGNIFPAGSGIWYHFVNTVIFKMNAFESKAMAKSSGLFWFFGTSLGIFFWGVYNIYWGLCVGIGMFIGGTVGIKQALRLWKDRFQLIILWWVVIFGLYFLWKWRSLFWTILSSI